MALGDQECEVPDMEKETTRKSKPRRRVTKAPEERRRDLLQAARTQFAEKGPTATSVADITEAANVGKGTFYLYFDSRDHVVGALWDEFVDGFVNITVELLANAGQESWLELAERMTVELINYDMDHMDIHRMVYSAANADALKMFREANQKILTILRGGIARGVADGAFDVRHPDLTADMLYYAAEGVITDAMLRGGDIDRERLQEAILEVVQRTLTPRQAQPSGTGS
jgi:AcrR family transcriptional regulator